MFTANCRIDWAKNPPNLCHVAPLSYSTDFQLEGRRFESGLERNVFIFNLDKTLLHFVSVSIHVYKLIQ